MLSIIAYISIATNLLLVVVHFPDIFALEAELLPNFVRVHVHASHNLLGISLDRIEEKFIIFLDATVLITSWRIMDSMVSEKSSHLLLEERRQDLQRHLVFYNSGDIEGVNLRQVRLSE